VQGATLPMMAKWLHVSVPEKVRRRFPLDFELKDNSKSELVELDIPDGSPSVGKQIVQLRLPSTAFVVLIHRHSKYLTATGETIIEPNDHILVMADNKQTVEKVYESFGITHTH